MMYNLSDQTTLNAINALVYQRKMVWVLEERVAEIKGLRDCSASLTPCLGMNI